MLTSLARARRPCHDERSVHSRFLPDASVFPPAVNFPPRAIAQLFTFPRGSRCMTASSASVESWSDFNGFRYGALATWSIEFWEFRPHGA